MRVAAFHEMPVGRGPIECRPWQFSDGSHREETEIRTPFTRPANASMWIAGVVVVVLATSGIVAIARSIPASYAGLPDEGTWSNQGDAPSGSGDAHATAPPTNLAADRAGINRGNRAFCPECGVIESIRQIERPGAYGRPDTANVKFAAGVSSGVSDSALPTTAPVEKRFEMTVRFRDGSTTVFNEASPRTWRSGGRVIVIGGSNAPKH